MMFTRVIACDMIPRDHFEELASVSVINIDATRIEWCVIIISQNGPIFIISRYYTPCNVITDGYLRIWNDYNKERKVE